jgi:hypothetical protein
MTLGLFVITLVMAVAAQAAKKDPMSGILGEYLKIQQALASDSIKGVAESAAKIVEAASEPGVESAGAILKGAKGVALARDIKAARAAFKQLSAPMVAWASKAKPAGVETVHCSMAPGSWVQKTGEISNPYYGAEMLTCGERH